jgi:molybdopterin synthase catalytic subunit
MVRGVFNKGDITISDEIRKFIERNSDGRAGAINIFIGKVKEKGRKGKVRSLYLEAYIDGANLEIENICNELKEKYNLVDIDIGHGLGEFYVGEEIVYVAIASKSREEMYKAMREAVKMYKTRPPIFKKEIYTDGSSEWI